MKQLFWLRKGKIAGRSGPNKDPWNLNEIKSAGFSAILSVNDGEGVHESSVIQSGLNYANISMSPNAPVRDGDLEHCLKNLPLAIKFIESNLINGAVLVHCRSGKDRTGLVLSAYLIASEGLSVELAMNTVFKVRPIAFSAEGWIEFGKQVLSKYISNEKGA